MASAAYFGNIDCLQVNPHFGVISQLTLFRDLISFSLAIYWSLARRVAPILAIFTRALF